MKPQPIYTVKPYSGAFIYKDARDTEQGTVIDVQLIGAPLPFSTAPENVIPFDRAQSMTAGDPVTLLAQEAVTVYGLDPARVQRAADLARTPYAIQNARRDEFGEPIAPTLKVLCVKASGNGWYVVRPNHCTCPDNAKGNVCKHRIAAWIHRESIIRPLAQARRTTPAQVLAELTA